MTHNSISPGLVMGFYLALSQYIANFISFKFICKSGPTAGHSVSVFRRCFDKGDRMDVLKIALQFALKDV